MSETFSSLAQRRKAQREVKLGCVFTQSGRGEGSTSYTGEIDAAAAFGRRLFLFAEAWRRGWSRARQKVVLGDGAAWIWNLAHEYFPGAVEIVDLYHARERLWELAGKRFPCQDKRRRDSASQLERQLDQGRIEPIVARPRGLETVSIELARQLALEADYFERNAARMRYWEFRRRGLFWSVRGASAITALHCARRYSTCSRMAKSPGFQACAMM